MANSPDDVELPDRGYNTQDLRSVTPKRKRRWGLWALTILVLLPAVLFALYTAATLKFSYSTGDRTGVVQKFSRKGWLCKTWEGELTMLPVTFGAPSGTFPFTVRDDRVAERINQLVRQGERVQLRYEQHRGVPLTCFGETEYFVVDAQPLGSIPGVATPNAAGTPAGARPGATVPPAVSPVPPTTTPPAAPTPVPTPVPAPAPPR
jgi:hypothetical protein